MPGLALCLALVAGTYLVLDRPERAALPGGGPERPVTSREVDAADLLDRLTDALTSGTRADARALAVPGDTGAADELAVLRGNVRRLGIADLTMRYVDENAGRSAADGHWVADVDLGWRIRGYDEGVSRMEVTMTLAETEDGAAFVSARDDHGEPAPLWLLDRLAVERSRDSLVMVAGDRVGDYDDLAAQAVIDVRKVLRSWRGRLVVEVPATLADLDRVVGSEDGSFGEIAAVTTPVDGSLVDGSPVHVFVNPPVFRPLGERGAQIVMSHEAAHVATDAATADLPTWLVEGFADYVALAHVDLPVTVTASQALDQVRASGPPAALPGPQDFDSANEDLGAAYEAAWLACRLIADRYGEDRLIAFYQRSDRDGGTTAAFGDVLGTSEQAFTRQWRRHLADLAG